VTRALCAICDCTNATSRICAECRADPANADWIAEWEDTSLTDRFDGSWPAANRLSAVIGTSVLAATPKQEEVFKLLLAVKVVTKPRRDRKGRSRGSHRRTRSYTIEEIARAVGVSHQYVSRLRRKLLFGAR
jgi:hypothetical protein